MDLTNRIQDVLSKTGNYIHGRDSENDDIMYTSISEWKKVCGLSSSSTDDNQQEQQQQVNDETRQKWYETGYDYYEDESKCPATVDGVLGGFACLSKRDLEGSSDFVRYLKSNIRPELKLTKEENDGVSTRACECGAGE